MSRICVLEKASVYHPSSPSGHNKSDALEFMREDVVMIAIKHHPTSDGEVSYYYFFLRSGWIISSPGEDARILFDEWGLDSVAQASGGVGRVDPISLPKLVAGRNPKKKRHTDTEYEYHGATHYYLVSLHEGKWHTGAVPYRDDMISVQLRPMSCLVDAEKEIRRHHLRELKKWVAIDNGGRDE